MKEIFVIYNKDTGFIDGGAGRVDRSTTPDGSTMAERIPGILAKDPNRKVVYLPNGKLPDSEKHKVIEGEIVDLTEDDLAAIKAATPKSEIDLLKERIEALEAK